MFERTKKGLWWDAALRINSGCTKVSAGCDHCWAESEARVRSGNPKVAEQWAGDFSGDVRLLPDNLERVLKAKKPQAWAVWNDLFHKSVPFEYIDQVVRAFVFNQRQLGIILTKRIERAAEYCNEVIKGDRVAHSLYCDRLNIPDAIKIHPNGQPPYRMPANIWLGTSAEDQARLEERAGHLLKCKAAMLFLSLEPCLGEMADLCSYLEPVTCVDCGHVGTADDFDVGGAGGGRCFCNTCGNDVPFNRRTGVNWVIVGAESRGGAAGRPCNIEWVRRIVYQCKAAGVPVFVKQLHIDGKLVKDISKFPEDLRVREIPEFKK